jgi:hypothetical protein
MFRTMRITLILLFIPFFGICQDFTKTETKRLEKVLERSSAKISSFNKNSLISVEKLNSPEVEGLIENALFTAGFKVVSNKVAQDAIKISNPLSSENKTIEITSTTQFKSVYVITVSGGYYQGAILGRCQNALLSFNARIVDLADDGRLVGTFRFSGNALTFVACEEDVANAFSYKLMQLTNN